MTVVCDWCRRPFERPHGRGPVPRYCSPSHRQRAYEARKLNRPGGPMSVSVIYRRNDEYTVVDRAGNYCRVHHLDAVGHLIDLGFPPVAAAMVLEAARSLDGARVDVER